MFNGKINELSMAMFNSYVSLPEGNNFLSLSIVLPSGNLTVCY